MKSLYINAELVDLVDWNKIIKTRIGIWDKVTITRPDATADSGGKTGLLVETDPEYVSKKGDAYV